MEIRLNLDGGLWNGSQESAVEVDNADIERSSKMAPRAGRASNVNTDTLTTEDLMYLVIHV